MMVSSESSGLNSMTVGEISSLTKRLDIKNKITTTAEIEPASQTLFQAEACLVGFGIGGDCADDDLGAEDDFEDDDLEAGDDFEDDDLEVEDDLEDDDLEAEDDLEDDDLDAEDDFAGDGLGAG
jgi:hypothetical protein